jgi:hypothetical protein
MRTKLKDITIRIAKSREDLEKLYRFRYAIYVEEMQRSQRYADHLRKRIEEPLDATAANFIAVRGDDIVGCIRWNGGQHTDFGEYVSLYDMRRAEPCFPERCSVTTKLMISPKYRRLRVGVDLCVAAFSHALGLGVVCDFMDCNPHLERYFARFGYRAYCGRISHPEYGDVLPMLLVFNDLVHLKALKSPLSRVAETYPPQPEVVRYFHDHVFSAAGVDRQSVPGIHPAQFHSLNICP